MESLSLLLLITFDKDPFSNILTLSKGLHLSKSALYGAGDFYKHIRFYLDFLLLQLAGLKSP